jgi:hypothetical protein
MVVEVVISRADRFHRFLEVDQDDLLVDPRFPDYATDRTREHGIDHVGLVQVELKTRQAVALPEAAAALANGAGRVGGWTGHSGGSILLAGVTLGP